MAACRGSSSKWFFTREQLENTPSRRCGIEPDRELSYRQQSANLIQDMGQRLNVSQLTINTAIVYMHRFYMHHSFTKFHRNVISPTTLFLAAKVEEQPRKLEHVIKVAHACLNPQETPLDTKSNAYLQQAQELVMLESIVLQTLASKDLAQTSYFMATNSLHLTTFCLQYKPTVIACVCIHLACKWSNWEIPVSTDGKHWWEYVDSSVRLELLDELTHEFLQILEKTPSRLKRIRNWRATQAAKKPKSESSQLTENSVAGTSINQDQGDASNPGFSKAGATLGATLALDCSYNTSGQSEWPVYASTCIKQEPQSISCQEATMPMQTSTSALLQHLPVYKTEKTLDFSPVKQEQKGGSMSKHQPTPQSACLPSAPPPPPQPSQAPKLSLDKYREKHAADLAVSGQKPVLELHGGEVDCDLKTDLSSSSSSSYASSFLSQLDHRKYSQFHQTSQSGSAGTTDSPMKVKAPSSLTSQEKRHNSDKWDKGLLKLRMAVPSSGGSSQLNKSGQSNKEDLKMKIKVSSSDRHGSSDEGVTASNANSKSKHSSPAVSKEKQHHNLHRHHKHSHTHSGNGRGEPEGPLRAPPGLATAEGTLLVPPGPAPPPLTSHKRVYAEVSHNHHPSSSFTTSCSKGSKTSKVGAGAAGGLRTSQQYPPQQYPPPTEPPHEVGEQRH
ncbi:cyclin-T2a isoform X2 [Takifugu flavidus]|uniref:cyclin-T2a isoform X2 n=1 Tax=Takifugu flavidus TaxID=433684 RepID=UPI002544379B|nr:cyclin-T2a isoform X2 [Takifugu flavidus]